MSATFNVNKPIIALLHIRALPGDPRYGREGNMKEVVQIARNDLHSLQEGGVDAILFANEFSLPYQKKLSHVTTSAMARIIGELMPEIKIPFGIHAIADPMATIDLAAATGASFVRSLFSGVFVGEYGLHDTDIATTIRRKDELGLYDLKMFYFLNSESEVEVNDRNPQTVARSLVFHCQPDGLCVSGLGAGLETSKEALINVKKAAGNTPVFCNTGCNENNVKEMLAVSDGAFVGTTFKYNGIFDNQIDPIRVINFMKVVKEYRESIS